MLLSRFKLRVTLSTAFVVLGIPFFIAFILYSYFYNFNIYTDNAKSLIQRHHRQVETEISKQLDAISDSLSYLKLQIVEDTSLVSSEKMNNVLRLHLTNNPELVSIFIASNAGNFRQVQRLNPNSIVAGRVAPKNAIFNIWSFEKNKAGDSFSRFDFFDATYKKIDSFTIKDDYDPRTRPFYKLALADLAKDPSGNFTQIDPPYLSRSTNAPTLTLATPIAINGEMIGMVGESFELSTLTKFLQSIQVSKDSQTYVLDEKGDILISGVGISDYKVTNGNLELININDRRGSPLEFVGQEKERMGNQVVEFKYGEHDTKYLALLNPFEKQRANRKWDLLTIAPQNDFLVALNKVNLNLMLFSLLAVALMVLVGFKLSKILSQPIETLTTDIKQLLDFNAAHKFVEVKSNLYEIQVLSDAIRKLKSTIDAFTSYVPRDLVNDLLRSGKPIEIGGESRYLTILFSDLENFSGLSEQTPARELLTRVSAYLKLFTYAIKEESGTVDKFIGDSVMAFWGAPLPDHDHAFHACKAALKGQKRMDELNDLLVSEGKPKLRARIGIHTDAVLVGNIGSTERLSYTVMGDGVNVAARLEGVNKDYGTQICVSHSVYKETGEKLWVRPIDQITVKGRKGEIIIYELIGTRDEDPETAPSKTQIELCQDTQRAFGYYVSGNYTKAAEEYSIIADQYQDQVAKIMADVCNKKLGSQSNPKVIAYDV
jgi:adenylate cyclase